MSVLKEFCDLSDTQIIVLSGFDFDFGVLLKDLKQKLVLNDASLTRAKDKLLEKGFIEKSETYYDFNLRCEVKIKDKREKAYRLAQTKDIRALEQLLYSLYLTTRIHNNMLKIVREMFPYKGTPLELDAFSLEKLSERIERILTPHRILYVFKTDIFNELRIELNKWKRFFERGAKQSNRLQNFFDKLQGNPVDDWAVLNSEIENYRLEIEKQISDEKEVL